MRWLLRPPRPLTMLKSFPAVAGDVKERFYLNHHFRKGWEACGPHQL